MVRVRIRLRDWNLTEKIFPIMPKEVKDYWHKLVVDSATPIATLTTFLNFLRNVEPSALEGLEAEVMDITVFHDEGWDVEALKQALDKLATAYNKKIGETRKLEKELQEYKEGYYEKIQELKTLESEVSTLKQRVEELERYEHFYEEMAEERDRLANILKGIADAIPKGYLPQEDWDC